MERLILVKQLKFACVKFPTETLNITRLMQVNVVQHSQLFYKGGCKVCAGNVRHHNAKEY